MTHPTDDSLKPCPFCGGAAALHPRTCDKDTPYNPADRAFPIVRCGQCGAEAVGKNWGRPETAAEKWNTRALLAEQARTEPVERLTVEEIKTLRQQVRNDPRCQDEHWFVLMARAIEDRYLAAALTDQSQKKESP